MKILVTKKGIVECYEDSYEEGELDYANSWDFDVRGEYDSAEDLTELDKEIIEQFLESYGVKNDKKY